MELIEDLGSPVKTPEQVCRFCRHEVGAFVQALSGVALRLQRMLPDGPEKQGVIDGLEAKGRRLVQTIEDTIKENITVPKTPPLRIVVVEDDLEARQYFVDVVTEQHHDVVGTAASGSEMIKVVLETKPDLVIFDIHLKNSDGISALREIMKKHPLPAVAITGDSNLDLVERAMQDDLIGSYNVKPLNKSQLVAAIMVAWGKWKQFLALTNEKEEVQQQLANRRIIERAKDRLVGMYGWNGDTAFRAMQRVATTKNWTLVEVAKKINEGKNIIPVEAR